MNKNKLLVKALSGTLCGAMLLTNITPVYALTTNEQSVSNVEDTRQTEVLYKKNASYFVTIPKNITLDSNKESSYSVKVDGDIASDQEVYVSPIDAISSKDGFNFYMKDQSTKHPKADVVADVAQNKFYWDYKDAADAYTETNNSISAHELSSGEWKGTFDFEINMHRISNEKGLTLSTDGDVTMGLNDTLQVNAYLDGTPVTDEVSWSSSNSSISVDKGLLKTSASAEVGDSSTITVVADTKEQLASVEKALSNVGIVTAHADDSLTASFKVTIVDIELSSYDLYIKPGESATLNATILPLGTEGTVNWTRTAVSGLNLKKNGNSVEIFIASDMEVGKTYQVVASFGDFSKVCTIHIGESAHKHTYTSKITKEPTCTEAGETTFTCVDGDDSYTQVIQPLGHNFSSEYTVDKEPTHTEAGSKSQHCSRCDAKQNVTSIPAIGHKYNDGVVTKKPTCTEKGIKTFTCVDGDYSYTEEIPTTGHKYGEATYTWSSDKSTCTAKRVCVNDASHVEIETVNSANAITKNATCTTTGTKTYTATFKNDAFAKQTSTSSIPATGHKYNSGVVTKKPTCTEKGVKTFTCVDGDHSYTEEIPATGHKYGEATYTWSNDKSTCTAKRVCTNNASHIEIETVNSTNAITKNATCTETGIKTYTAIFKNGAFEKQITTSTIPALGHDFNTDYTIDKNPTHTEDGSKSQHCKRCGAKQNIISISATGHTYNAGVITKNPTCTEKGLKTYTCIGGDHTYTEEIPATGHKYGAPTYTWNSDKTTCTAKRVCANDASHVEKETVNATSAITKKATCTTTGTKTYTATFKNGAFAKQTSTTSIPAIGHKYGTPTYTWSADGKTCTAKRVCANNSSHIETENATITNKVKVNANCTTKGTTTYTATFKNSAFTTQTKDVQDINALGHNYASTYTIDKNATCTEVGSKSQHCSRCNAKQNVTSIPATGHKYVNGVCTICGEKNYGADVTLTSSNLSSYGISTSGDVVIPGEVRDKKGVLHKITAIDRTAFYGCSNLTSITIPESVTSINAEGFGKCPNLSSIIVDTNNKVYDSRNGCNAIIEKSTNTLIVGCKNTIIPNSVTGIGYKAFYGCSNLTSITIPNSVTSIGLSAFYECTSLTSITIPNSVTNIENSAFNSCYKLTSIKLPDKITSIGIGVFAGCASLTSITIPNSVTSIGNNAFSGCSSLASITIPSSVTSIGNGAFRGCKSLTSITIPDSVTSISNNMFDTCTMLTSITIPESITNIGSYAFHNCWSLNEFNYKGISYTRATKNDLINALKSNGVSVDTNAFTGL